MSLTAIYGFSLTLKEIEAGRELPKLSPLTLSVLAPKAGGLQEAYAEKAAQRAREETKAADTGLDKAAEKMIVREAAVTDQLKNTGGMK